MYILDFHGVNFFSNFFNIQNQKFTISIFKKLPKLPHENLVNILGGHGIEINTHGCQPNLEMTIYVLKTGVNPNM